MSRALAFFVAVWMAGIALFPALGDEARIIKVLPHLLDEQGRISLAPGLFERAAYQKQLRNQPARVSGLRYDVQWKAPDVADDRLKIRMFLRTARREPNQALVVEAGVKENRRLGGWSSVRVEGSTYRDAGEVLAWRAVLLDGETEIAEQKSFLW